MFKRFSIRRCPFENLGESFGEATIQIPEHGIDESEFLSASVIVDTIVTEEDEEDLLESFHSIYESQATKIMIEFMEELKDILEKEGYNTSNFEIDINSEEIWS